MTHSHITRETVDIEALCKASGHKYTHGHVLVMSGGAGKSGAARLAARGALRIGAGLVTLGVPTEAFAECAAQVTAIMLRQIEGATSFTEVMQDPRINALCIGPGFGITNGHCALVKATLRAERPTVLDADALNLLATAPSLRALLHSACVLTPHSGEFARLFPDLAETIKPDSSESKISATKRAAHRIGCVVLLKGVHTVIAHPDGQVCEHLADADRAVPWLATAGAGDVLAGFVAGLMARGVEPMAAATHAAWLHVECARVFGPGLVAEDLPEMLPQVFRSLIV
jgi:hydroxyethylthiazole kinase-like uncharacterized protein yjeF